MLNISLSLCLKLKSTPTLWTRLSPSSLIVLIVLTLVPLSITLVTKRHLSRCHTLCVTWLESDTHVVASTADSLALADILALSISILTLLVALHVLRLASEH